MSAADAPFIRRHTRDEKDPLGFWGLRAQGLANVQALSAEHWTDYNLHDPGVTILEQVCYALTGLVYRSEFPVADHLAGPDGRIDLRAHSLHPADIAFPCRPTTADDYRRFLLDRIDGLADAIVEADATTAPGVWRVALRLASEHEGHAHSAVRQATDLLRSHRNIGEDFAHEVALVEDRWCRLAGEIEIGGAREPSDILAEVYLQCEQQIAAWGSFEPLDALLDTDATLEEIFSGPPVHRGRLTRPARDDDRIFISDLMAGLRSIEGVREVRRLTLAVEGDDALPREAIERRGPGWALRLRVPNERSHGSELRLYRRGTLIEPAPGSVHMKYDDLLAGTRSLQAEAGATAFIGPRPRGVHREAGAYRPVQEQFPAVYAINHSGLEPNASNEDRAQVWQLKAYLALFDQVMAHSAAQLSHLRELFKLDAGDGAGPQTYWWQVIDNGVIEHIEHRLYTATPQHIEQKVFRAGDDYMDRKGRLLDYLLSLHGEDYSQNTLRQFASGYTPAELEARLFENKASVLRDIVQISRDRGAGFDDSKPVWDRVGQEGGLQRRVGLLLGFVQTHTRSLTDAFNARTKIEQRVAESRLDSHVERHAMAPEGLQRVSLDSAAKKISSEEAEEDSQATPSLDRLDTHQALMRCGAQADHYWMVPMDDGSCRLFVGPDEHGGYWDLGVQRSPGRAARVARRVRNLLLGMNEHGEGLFIVEHILLRPEGSSAAHRQLQQKEDLPEDGLAQRVTAVFPAWPVRCREENFRHLAAETVRINAPAHLRTDCIWLDYDEMKTFETAWRKWLDERREWCLSHDSDAERVRMNHAACDVLSILFDHIQEVDGGGAT